MENDEKLKQLELEIQKLKEEIQSLKEAVFNLAYSKTTDPKFAFFDWLVRYGVVFNGKRERLDWVMHVLECRLEQKPLSKQKSIPGVSYELLYKESVPTYEETKTLLMQVLETNNEEIVKDLIDSLIKQGIRNKLVEYLQQHR
ncbi:MAG: hypothetical protein BLM47_12360 [Candidatus Reconcilbacillus cellulovorans]|uniref:Uncharacterized protein n=1 Tax=Candidatus Reconcilbacillus cellulovorans TaxID=1906605 RepID=A0A2A6DXK4_9BACL|nr:MAG: hypothetical protein BLM47_12360 [Candidatus Reconcilbacillus cellulovorans]